MAAGDFVVFDTFVEKLGQSKFDFDTFTNGIKMGIIDNTGTYTTTTLRQLADPRWAAGGTPDLSAQQVTPGGNYASGGPDLTATIADADVWSRSGTTTTFDLDDVSILQNGSNPSGAYWGIIYDDDATNKDCIGFVEIGTNVDLSAGDFTITWNASGLFTTSTA